MRREHPLRIVRYSTKNLWLLIFPILRGAYHFTSQEDVIEWLQGTWMDLLVLLVIFGYGYLDWYFRTFTIVEQNLFVQEGFFYTRKRCMPIRNISAMTIEHPFWLRAVGGAYLYLDTAAGRMDSTDIKLMIRVRDETIFLAQFPKIRKNETHHYEHRVGLKRMLLFSVLFSSSFSGAVYMSVFWFQGGKIARDLINQFHLAEYLSNFSAEVADKLTGIPPAAVTVGILILALWIISFVKNIFRYGNFNMESDSHLLKVRSGLLTRRRFFIVNQKINFVDIQQNLLTKFSRIYTLAVNCPGYGNDKGSIPICMPILTKKELDTTLPMIFPDIRITKNQLHAPYTAWWGYTYKQLILFVAMIPAVKIGCRLLPQIEDVISFFGIMVEIPILWKLVIQVAGLLTTGVSITDGRICVRYSKGMEFHTIITDTDCLVKVEIQQHIWQKWFGTCHVILYFQAEITKKCKLLTLNYQDVQKLFSEFLPDETKAEI
ncbi:MAG: PH domain-containing protein [Oscillospiraceae bacterium]